MYTDEQNYYNGYLLDDVYTYELAEKDLSILDNAIMLVDNNWSLRQLSKNVCRSRSQLSRDFQKPLRGLSYELYVLVHKRYKEHYQKYFR